MSKKPVSIKIVYKADEKFIERVFASGMKELIQCATEGSDPTTTPSPAQSRNKQGKAIAVLIVVSPAQ